VRPSVPVGCLDLQQKQSVFRRDGLEHRRQIVTVIFCRTMTRFAPNIFANDGINRETELRDDNIRAGCEQRVCGKLDNFVGTIA